MTWGQRAGRVLKSLLLLLLVGEIAATGMMVYFWGLSSTLAFMAGSAMLGIFTLLDDLGEVWRDFRAEIGAGVLPTSTVLDGALLFISALLLIVPGPITSVLGFMLQTSPARRAGSRLVSRHLPPRLPGDAARPPDDDR